MGVNWARQCQQTIEQAVDDTLLDGLRKSSPELDADVRRLVRAGMSVEEIVRRSQVTIERSGKAAPLTLNAIGAVAHDELLAMRAESDPPAFEESAATDLADGGTDAPEAPLTVLPEIVDLKADLAAEGHVCGKLDDSAGDLARSEKLLRSAQDAMICPFRVTYRRTYRSNDCCGECEVCKLAMAIDGIEDQVAGLRKRVQDRLGEAGY